MYKLFKKLISNLNIQVSNNTFEDTLMAHPLYPTLSSISDSFDLWGIEYIIAKLSLDDINDINAPILSSLSRNEPIIIVKIKDEYVYFRDSNYRLRRCDKSRFIETWNGISIIIQNKDNSKKNSLNFKNLTVKIEHFLTISILILMAIGGINCCIINWSKDVWLTTATKVLLLVNNIIGVLICYLLYKSKLNLSSNFINRFCVIGQHADCKKVINSLDGKFFFSNYIIEIAAGYFTSAVLWLIFAPLSVNWVFPLSIFFLLSIPIIIVSLALQIFYLKKICILCCLILVCLLINILTIKAGYIYDSFSLVKYTLLFLSLTYIYIVIYKADNYKTEYYKIRRSNARIKYDLNTIKAHLSNTRLKTPDYGFNWGNSNSQYELTAIVSFECKHCKELVREILYLKDIYKNIHYKIIFDVQHNQVGIYNYLSYMYYLYEHDNDKFDEMLNRSGFFKKQIKSNDNKYDVPDQEKIDKIFEIQRNFIEKTQITYVPSILINGRLLSVHYNNKDIIPIIQLISKL
jgi:hypothetical protein